MMGDFEDWWQQELHTMVRAALSDESYVAFKTGAMIVFNRQQEVVDRVTRQRDWLIAATGWIFLLGMWVG